MMTEEEQGEVEVRKGLFAALSARGRRWLSAASRHCEQVEQAKEACERENTLKNGKDWVNRCCG